MTITFRACRLTNMQSILVNITMRLLEKVYDSREPAPQVALSFRFNKERTAIDIISTRKELLRAAMRAVTK